MTEITRVPLQPIGRGSVVKLWLGLLALVLAGAGIAWAALPPHVTVQTLRAGTGPSPTRTDVALINYVGHLPDGTVFDQAKQAVLPLDQVVPGFTKALEQMQRGGRYKVLIPAALAYGDKQTGPIPPNTDLRFDIDLIEFRSRAEIEQQRRIIEQLQQMQGRAGQGQAGQGQAAPMPGGAPPGAEAPPPPAPR